MFAIGWSFAVFGRGEDKPGRSLVGDFCRGDIRYGNWEETISEDPGLRQIQEQNATN